MKTRLPFLVFLLIACCSPLTAQKIDYTRWVNPFIGTGGNEHTIPGPTTTLGMLQLAPETPGAGWAGSYGYHYSVHVDLNWRDNLLGSELRLVGNNRIEGFRRSSSWAKDQTIYFVAEFSEPINGSTALTTSESPPEVGIRASDLHFNIGAKRNLVV